MLTSLRSVRKDEYRRGLMWDAAALANSDLVSHTSGTTGQMTWRHRSMAEAAVIAKVFAPMEQPEIEDRTLGLVIRYHRHGMEMPVPGTMTTVPVSFSEDIDVRQAVELFRSGCALRGVRCFPSVVAGGGMDVALLGTAIDRAGAGGEAARVERVVLGGFVPETVRTIIAATFPNASVFEHYSLAEIFGGASKSPRAAAFVSDAHIVAEVLDDDDAATPVGSIGELTLTELFPFVQVQPLIRYRTGDLVQRHRCDEPGRVAFRWWGRRSGSIQRADGAWILGEGPMIDALLDEPVVARSVHRGHLAVATPTIAMPVAKRVDDPLDGTALEVGIRRAPSMRNGDLDAILARLGQAVTPDACPDDLVLSLFRADDRSGGPVRFAPALQTLRRVLSAPFIGHQRGGRGASVVRQRRSQ